MTCRTRRCRDVNGGPRPLRPIWFGSRGCHRRSSSVLPGSRTPASWVQPFAAWAIAAAIGSSRGGVIYSFARPERGGLGDFLDDGFEAIDTIEWAHSKDLDTLAMFADLLRQALIEQEHHRLRYHSAKRLFVFRSPRDDRDAMKVKVAPNKPGRTVFQRYYKDDQHTEPKDCRHYAAAVRFVHTDAGWAAEINPTYHFTFDGHRDLPWGEDRIKGMKRIEKNLAVRGLMQFWAEYLARPSELGDRGRALLFGDLIRLGVGLGINDKEWQPPSNDGQAIGHPDSGQQELWR